MIRIDNDTINGYIIHVETDEGFKSYVVEDTFEDEFAEARLNHKLLTMLQNILEYYPSKHVKINCRVVLEGEDDAD